MPYVNVQIDMVDIDDSDIEEEYIRRGLGSIIDGEEQSAKITEIFYALKFGLDSKALDLTRNFICETLGVIL